MQCPRCKHEKDRVVDSRLIGAGHTIRRRRECLACHRRYTTYERIEAAPRVVIKKDFRRELFRREKVLVGLAKACKKRRIDAETLEDIVDRIEADVYADGESEVETRIIGEHVSRHLKDLDPVAFLRFASVYREFSEVQQFLQEAEELGSGEAR